MLQMHICFFPPLTDILEMVVTIVGALQNNSPSLNVLTLDRAFPWAVPENKQPSLGSKSEQLWFTVLCMLR